MRSENNGVWAAPQQALSFAGRIYEWWWYRIRWTAQSALFQEGKGPQSKAHHKKGWKEAVKKGGKEKSEKGKNEIGPKES